MAGSKDYPEGLPKIWGGSNFNEKGGSILLDNLQRFWKFLEYLKWRRRDEEKKANL